MTNDKTEPNYWVVGASWGGTDDQADRFVREGIWQLGWERDNPDDSKKYYDTALEIKPNDRLAIKSMLGRGASDMQVKHIGIVKSVQHLEDKTILCVVNWLAVNLQRKVDIRGCMGSVQGPYTWNQDVDRRPWVHSIFCL